MSTNSTPAQPVDGGQRQPVGDTCNLRLDHRRDEHAAHAEHERPQQADAPVKIEFVVGVVPPAGMKQRLHDPGCDVFQYAGTDHRKQEHHQGIVHLSQHHDGADRAHTVNRAQRAVEESAVDWPALQDGHENGLVHPSAEAVEQEPQEQFFHEQHQTSTSRLREGLCRPSCADAADAPLSIAARGLPDSSCGLENRSREKVSRVALILSAMVTR